MGWLEGGLGWVGVFQGRAAKLQGWGLMGVG